MFLGSDYLLLLFSICVLIPLAASRPTPDSEVKDVDLPDNGAVKLTEAYIAKHGSDDLPLPKPYTYKYESGVELLPEVALYMVAVEAAAYQALLVRQPFILQGHYTYRNVQLSFGGESVEQSIAQGLFLFGLEASVYEIAHFRQFLDGVYHLFDSQSASGQISFKASPDLPTEVIPECVPRAQLDDILRRGAGLTIAAPGDTENTGAASISTAKRQINEGIIPVGDVSLSKAQRSVYFCWQSFGTPEVKREAFFPIIIGLLRLLTPYKSEYPVKDRLIRYAGIQLKIRQLSTRIAPPAWLIWEDAIHMLYTAAKACTDHDTWKYVKVQTKYIVGSAAEVIGDLVVEKMI